MAQIFASEKSSSAVASARRARQQPATAPELRLAGLQAKADGSGPTSRLSQLQGRQPALQRAEDEEALQGKLVQRMEEEEPLQGKLVQRVEDEEMLQGKLVQRVEEEEPLQGKARAGALQRKADGGGLPASLQQGISQLSGTDVSDVNVHYNSPAPAQVGAHAFAQGRDIHLASGQERHLPHEAWHVVQQQQGRVAPTVDIAGTPVNDDPGLEREADVMGAKASQLVAKENSL